VGIRGRDDPTAAHLVRLTDHGRTRRLEARELALHIGRLQPPDHATRLLVLALDLIVSAERDARVAELPTEIAAVLPPWLAEELRVIRLELRGIVRSDQHTVELHRPSPFSDGRSCIPRAV